MRNAYKLLLSLAVAMSVALLGACGESAQSPQTAKATPSAPAAPLAEGFAISHVSVVDMDSATVLNDQTVLIEEDRITHVGPSGSTRVPAGYQTIDGSGKYLAPGLADLHAHPMTQQDLDLYLASGVTFIRAMWGEPIVLAMRDEVVAGTRSGPRIMAGGRIVDGEPVIHYGSDQVLTAGQAQQVVQAQQAAGYDFIKVYSNLSGEAFDAIAAAAKAAHIPFAGHIPTAVSIDHAMQSGMLTSEHMIGISQATLHDGKTLMERFDPGFRAFAESIGSGAEDLTNVFDEAKLKALAQRLAASDLWTVPTLAVLRGVSLSTAQAEAEWQRPEMTYTDYTVKEFWRLGMGFSVPGSDDYHRGMDQYFAHELSQVKALHDAGARLLVGTDSPNPYVYVGFSVVDEMELFVKAGLSPFDALQAATTNVADFLGETGLSGAVREGARADLVLLESNPLEDVAAYRKNQGVMAGGHWLDRADLDQRLAAVVTRNEYKASRFDGAPAWPLAGGEQVLFQAAFELNDAELGYERVAPVTSAEGQNSILAQRFNADQSALTVRVELDEQGRAVRLVKQVSQDGGRDGSIGETVVSRNAKGYLITRADGTTSTVTGAAGIVLTGTAADWLSLQNEFAAMQDRDTREVSVWKLSASDQLEAYTVTLKRHPSEVLVGHFYFTGSNPYDVELSGPGGVSTARVWMGGGFYTGWPVKVEIHSSGHSSGKVATPTRYRRFL